MERETGVVKWFDRRKGYGFVMRDSGEDVFVHYREIQGDGFRMLKEGQRVEYKLIERDKGYAAEEITVVPQTED